MKLPFLLSLACLSAALGSRQKPAVLVSILIRNKAHVLPYFFTYLENLDYPKDRLGLWIRSDHNDDRSVSVIDTWLNVTQNEYLLVNKKYKMGIGKRAQEKTSTDWPYQRLVHVMNLKEEALRFARDNWYDFVFFLDADVILSNNQTLNSLVGLKVPVVAPLLRSDAGYSNFWDSIEGEVKSRTDRHREILESNGTQQVECVANAVLVDLNLLKSDQLTFEKKILNSGDFQYNGPFDPDLVFCTSAKLSGSRVFLETHQDSRVAPLKFGYVMPPTLDLDSEQQSLTNILLDVVHRTKGHLQVKPYLQNFVVYPKPDSLGLDRIFVINLDRRPDLRHLQEQQCKVAGLRVERFAAIDAMNLTQLDLNNMGIKILPGYRDPYHKRPIKLGEIGCFLSHYGIWKKMVKQNISVALINEDDLKLLPDFKERATAALKEAQNWDLLYFSRKWISGAESKVPDSENLVHSAYSYWTVSYALTLEGARKLIASKPFENLLPVDEFLPIMYGKHPNEEWTKFFPTRNLRALAVTPNLAEPLYFTREPGHVSDTEASEVLE